MIPEACDWHASRWLILMIDAAFSLLNCAIQLVIDQIQLRFLGSIVPRLRKPRAKSNPSIKFNTLAELLLLHVVEFVRRDKLSELIWCPGMWQLLGRIIVLRQHLLVKIGPWWPLDILYNIFHLYWLCII